VTNIKCINPTKEQSQKFAKAIENKTINLKRLKIAIAHDLSVSLSVFEALALNPTLRSFNLNLSRIGI